MWPPRPLIDVTDAEEGRAAERLGFSTEYIAGSPPEFAMCTRDGFSVMLRRVDDAARVRPIESQGGAWDAFFWVDDARNLHDEFAARGVPFA